MGLLDFGSTYQILFGVPLKQSSFWFSGDFKAASNEIVHAMLRQCMFALSICTQLSLMIHLSTQATFTLDIVR